jgi:nicotinate-nucleotide pyrophosphorylase (carboxylating)
VRHSTESSNPLPLYPFQYEPSVRGALEEDLGRAGDITTNALVPSRQNLSARLVTRADGVVAGLDVAHCAFRVLDENTQLDFPHQDGDRVVAGDLLASVQGSARAILTAERVALNFLGRLSGIATATAKIIAAIERHPTRVSCTRKTTPGLRALEKYAVRVGGGFNHRFGLDDGVLIKDNHLVVAGGITRAVERAKATVGHMVKIQVEVDTLEQLEEALCCPIDAVLLDNMSLSDLRTAVEMVSSRVITEASGNITVETAKEIAATGVDILSVGWLTHSAPTLDVALDIEDDPRAPSGEK